MKINFKYNTISKYRGMMMGIVAISIILFHFSNECRMANINYHQWNEFIINYISSSGVDIFLILSGYGLYYSFKKNSNIKEFYKRRFTKILIPYIIFCLPAIIIKYMIIRNGNLLDVFNNFFFITLFTEGQTWFWYVLLIMVCYLIFPKIFNLIESTSEINREMSIITLITSILLMNLLLSTNVKPLFSNINILTLRIPIFILGVCIGQKSYNNEELSLLKIIIMIGCAILFYQTVNNGMILRRYELALIAILTYTILIMIFEKIAKFRWFKIIKSILEKIGTYSLELYLTHVCIVSIINETGNTTATYKYFLIEILFTIVASIVIKKITNLISKKLNIIGWSK